MTCTWAVDEPLPLLGGKDVEGIIGVNTMKLWSEKDDPFIKWMTEITKEVGRRQKDLLATYFLGTANVLALYDLLNQLVPKVGWDGINARSLRRQFETWGEGYDLHGLVKLDYTPELRAPMTARLVEIKGGQWVQITPWKRLSLLIPDNMKGPYKDPARPPITKKVY